MARTDNKDKKKGIVRAIDGPYIITIINNRETYKTGEIFEKYTLQVSHKVNRNDVHRILFRKTFVRLIIDILTILYLRTNAD